MTEKSNSLIHTNYFLEAGYLFLAIKSTVVSTVLGSSVSVCIYDRKRKLGGRKIVFDTGTCEIAVIKVEKLRNKDWYPYAGFRDLGIQELIEGFRDSGIQGSREANP